MGQAWPLGADAQRLGLGPAEAKWCVESGCGPAFALLIAVFALSWWLVEQRGRRLGMLWWARWGQRAEAA